MKKKQLNDSLSIQSYHQPQAVLDNIFMENSSRMVYSYIYRLQSATWRVGLEEETKKEFQVTLPGSATDLLHGFRKATSSLYLPFP